MTELEREQGTTKTVAQKPLWKGCLAIGNRRPGWSFGLGFLLSITAVVVFAGFFAHSAGFNGWIGSASAVCAGLVMAMLLGPPRFILTVFITFMAVSHQDRSLLVIPFQGIEWHPRELLLFVLMAYGAIRFFQGKADLRPDLMHFFMLFYVLFFVYIAIVGILRQPSPGAVIAECRYPIFLGAFFVFVTTPLTREDLRYYIRLVAWLSLAIAGASLLFFAYTLLTGQVMNVQNALGEYVPRQIGPYLLQSLRPNGHVFFEAGAVVLTALLLCPEIPRQRKVLYLGCLALFLGAILVTMMRTAYISLAVSLLALLVLFLPAGIRILAALTLTMIVLSLVLVFSERIPVTRFDEMEVSLKGRYVETEGALDTFFRAPLAGSGMGSTFRGMGYVSKTTLLSVAEAEYQTVHNVWLYYLFKGGLLGMLLVLTGMGGMVSRAYGITSRLTVPRDRYLILGLLAAWIGQLAASLAMPRLTSPFGAFFLALMACAFVVMARTEAPVLKAPS